MTELLAAVTATVLVAGIQFSQAWPPGCGFVCQVCAVATQNANPGMTQAQVIAACTAPQRHKTKHG